MSDQQTTFTHHALSEVNTFVKKHPEYTLDGVEQPGQGATNRVIFARCDDELVVFKVFCELERKQRACFAFTHWEHTGLVPKLIKDASPDMILITYIPGIYLGESRINDTVKIWHTAVKNTSCAIASLTRTRLSAEKQENFISRFYRPLGEFESYLHRILELGWRIHNQDPTFMDNFWGDNLRFIVLGQIVEKLMRL